MQPSVVTRARPGWPEVLVGALAYLVAIVVTVVLLRAIPDDQDVFSGLAALALSGVIGLAAFAAAFVIRIRTLAPFGFRRTTGKWLLAGAGGGLLCFLLGLVVSGLYVAFTGDSENIQADYQSAADGGALALVATLLFGAVLTPLGEESYFRGVLANGLERYGPWVSVLVSAAVFAVAHGINPVMPVAFTVGVVTALLFRRTGSLWPGVFVHAVNNALAATVPLFFS
ncbi:CPBP family intramembrane glutamic endopeptidase [Cryptosporangium arvum]|uniref:Putative protease of the Abi (CAAX) family n=1 Tax=Cryptosporangium arvum DSM 44712 TaxID=927661 RepID=A0A011ALA0_9ACTN|nr:type II CAAX endopeptidase family protein [Cryptosporangium arvum]EXG82716.1 putative protease of the Abi (CAAX) family [Cryptosporangium arvum DSM 44712]